MDPEDIIVVLAAPVAYQLVLNPAPQLALALLPNPVYKVAIPAVVHPIVQIVQQTVQMVVNLATGGVRGLQGEQGPPGQRGSLLLGVYGTGANLPAPDNEGLFVGDFAFDLQGNFYMIEETA